MEGKILSAPFLFFVLAYVWEYKLTSANICASAPAVLNNPTGNFSSPNYPNNYPHNTNQTWKIVAPVGQVIDLYFASFSLERSSSCQHDYVKIRNRCEDAVPMAVYCGHTAKPLRSSNNVLWVEFRSDVSNSLKGFEAMYTMNSNTSKLVSCPRPSDNQANIDYCSNESQVQCCNKNDSSCRVNKILTAKSGTITSPGYPNHYPSGKEYFWRITVPKGYVVQINFTTLVTHHTQGCSGCKCDYVHVLDGPCPFYNFGPRWCGAWTSQSKYPSFITTGRHMVVFFRSDNDDNNEVGFRANYRRALTCNGNKPISCTKNSEASCCTKEARTCFIQTSVRSHCPRDGDPTSQDVCCTINGSPTCCHNPLSSICANRPIILNTTAGNLSSPNYPNQYPNNATKIWKIVAPRDQVIDFYFEAFDLEDRNNCNIGECGCDFVQIRNNCDDKTPVERYCGKNANSFRSTSNTLWIEFRSDSTITKKGFAAFFASVPKSSKPISCPRPADNQANIDRCLDGNTIGCCNRNSPLCKFDKLLTAKNGKFTSPNYPNDYPPNTKFTWRITVPEGFVVQLNFTKFKIYNSDLCSRITCTCDYLSVQDGPCSDAAVRGKWCTSFESKLPSYISTGRHLLVHFKSDSIHSLDGFEANYRRALKCRSEAPYSCLKEGNPACCAEDGRKSTASKAATNIWFIVITIVSTLSTTLV